MAKVNIIAKGAPGREYIMVDMIATRLTRKKFEALQAINPDMLGDYRYIPYSETDFSWWGRISKKLTSTKIATAYFDIDARGDVTEY